MVSDFTDKKYCTECVRHGVVKIVNFSLKQIKSSIDSSIYVTSFVYDKIISKSGDVIHDILAKVATHSFDGYNTYIKKRFIETYQPAQGDK